MSTANKNAQEFEFTGKHMLMAMVAFFGVIIAVNFTMASLATGSWTGLVVKNSYVASQQFNRDLEAAKAQQALGLHSTLSYWQGRLTFELKNRENETLKADTLVAEIGRPAFEQKDLKLEFLPGRDGTYVLPVALEEGVWAISITGKTGDDTYRRDARIFVDKNGMGRLE